MKMNVRQNFFTLSVILGVLLSSVAMAADADKVKNGEYLVRIGDCLFCHSFTGVQDNENAPRKVVITREFTEEQFSQVVRGGLSPEGVQLPPPMPFDHYSFITDEDLADIYTYYTDISKTKYTKAEKLTPAKEYTFDKSKSEQINRGGYLIDGLGHCNSCHGPSDDSRRPLSGGSYEKWVGYNISSDKNGGIGTWSQADLVRFLQTGHVDGKGNAAGVMGLIVQNSLQYASLEDAEAIAAYLLSSTPYNDGEKQARDSWGKAITSNTPKSTGFDLYTKSCASCHNRTGEGRNTSRLNGYPSLIHNTTVGAPTHNNLVLFIMEGSRRSVGNTNIYMPKFSNQLNDQQLADLVTFLTNQFGDPSVKTTAEDVKQLR